MGPISCHVSICSHWLQEKFAKIDILLIGSILLEIHILFSAGDAAMFSCVGENCSSVTVPDKRVQEQQVSPILDSKMPTRLKYKHIYATHLTKDVIGSCNSVCVQTRKSKAMAPN